MRADHKGAKLSSFFALLVSVREKAARKMLVKLQSGIPYYACPTPTRVELLPTFKFTGKSVKNM